MLTSDSARQAAHWIDAEELRAIECESGVRILESPCA